MERLQHHNTEHRNRVTIQRWLSCRGCFNRVPKALGTELIHKELRGARCKSRLYGNRMNTIHAVRRAEARVSLTVPRSRRAPPFRIGGSRAEQSRVVDQSGRVGQPHDLHADNLVVMTHRRSSFQHCAVRDCRAGAERSGSGI